MALCEWSSSHAWVLMPKSFSPEPNVAAQNSARAIRLLLGLQSSIAPTADTNGAPIVAQKRLESRKALDLLKRRPCGANATVRMTPSRAFEWWFLVQAVKEMDYSTMPSCLPYRDKGRGQFEKSSFATCSASIRRFLCLLLRPCPICIESSTSPQKLFLRLDHLKLS